MSEGTSEVYPATYRNALSHPAELYGGLREAACYCGFEDVPHPPYGRWIPTWLPEADVPTVARLIRERDSAFFELPLLVPNQKLANAWREAAECSVRVIGTPVLYVKPEEVSRTPDSLLVLPDQQLLQTGQESALKAYLKAMAENAVGFKRTSVCLPASRMQDADLQAFVQGTGMQFVELPLLDSLHGLRQFLWLGARHQYVTSAVLSTELVFMAYAGAHPSVFCNGELPAVHAEDESVPLTLALLRRDYGASWVEEHLPALACKPHEATSQQQWAAAELGESHKLPAHSLRNTLRWPGAEISLSDNAADRLSGQRPGNADEVESFFKVLAANTLGSSRLSVSMEAVFFPLQEAAWAGQAIAQYLLGLVYYLGLFYDWSDKKEALNWFLRAADQGHAVACLYAASILLEKEAPNESRKQVRRLLTQAAEAGVREASALLKALDANP